MKNAIHPTRAEDFAKWYQEIIVQSELADNSIVRGCMVIRPWGYGIWEQIQSKLDARLKKLGHSNAYFPMLIPLSHIQKEAEHVEGFAKECAVVTHHRLEQSGCGKLEPAGKLDEPFVVRPTSETLIGTSFAKWINSYRDLPLLINQWANVMRWEMRPRLFIRTSEFLWQEGHTVHETAQQAQEQTERIIDLYEDFLKKVLSIPVIQGKKCEWEKFPGAVCTHTIEAMMQDGKALQAGTSHFLGQNFSKASDIRFTNRKGVQEYPWTTSWGVSTRLIGALLMVHSDDNGLILPTQVAPSQVVIIPITNKKTDTSDIDKQCNALLNDIIKKNHHGTHVRAKLDNRDDTNSSKKWEHIKKGVPIIIEVGPKELAEDCVLVTTRWNQIKEVMPRQDFISKLPIMLKAIDRGMYDTAHTRLRSNIIEATSLARFKYIFEEAQPTNKFVLAPFLPSAKAQQILNELGVTVRCIPKIQPSKSAACIFTGAEAKEWAIYAKAY